METSYKLSDQVVAAHIKDSQGPPPRYVEWDPRHQGQYLLTQLANADVLNNGNFSFQGAGVRSSSAIYFSYDNFATTSKTLRLEYDAATDSYRFNPDGNLIVRLDPAALHECGAAGLGNHARLFVPGNVYFQINNNGNAGAQAAPYNNDTFVNIFNDFGRTEEGPTGGLANPFAVAAGAGHNNAFLKLIFALPSSTHELCMRMEHRMQTTRLPC